MATTRSFRDFLLGQTWDGAIQLTRESNAYYDNPVLDTAQGRLPGPRDDVPAAPSPLQRIRSALHAYRVGSSKVRLLVHGFAAAYLLYVATHPSRNVSAQVTYSPAKFAQAPSPGHDGSAGSGGHDGGHGWAPLRALGRVLRAVLRYPAAACGAGSGSGQGDKGDGYAALNARVKEAGVVYLYQSREGMQLLMREPVTSAKTLAHTLLGCLLIPLSLIQLESVFYMSHARARAAATAGQSAADVQASIDEAYEQVKNVRQAHCVVGCASVAGMLSMTASGLALRAESIFANSREYAGAVCDFGTAIVYFAMPWGLLSAGIMGSALAKKTVPHAIVGGLIAKACLAVPLARMLGGALQSLAGVRVRLPATAAGEPVHIVHSVPGELERVYYLSIGLAATVVGVWAAYDIQQMLTHAHTVYEREKEKKR